MAENERTEVGSWTVVTSTVPEPAVVLELTEVLQDYARHQQLLLQFLRAFRTDFLEPGLPPPPSAPSDPSDPGVARTSGTPRDPSVVNTPSPLSAAAASKWLDDVFGPEVRPTRRDYDYFGDLDERLAQLAPVGASMHAVPDYEGTNPTMLWTDTPSPGSEPT